MIPTNEDFQEILISMINNHDDLEKYRPEDFYTFKVCVCDTNINEKYECLTKNTIFSLSTQFYIHRAFYRHKIYKTRVIEKNGVLQLWAHFYIINNTNNKYYISDIDKSDNLRIYYVLSQTAYKCSICGATIINECDCIHHELGKIYSYKLAYNLIENANLMSWTLFF